MPTWLSNFITSAVMKSWQTTALGCAVAAYVVIRPALESGRWPTKSEWLMAVAAALAGLLVKDHNKTGTGSVSEPIRGPETFNPDHGAS